jgi:PAS domain S-box-containing protein
MVSRQQIHDLIVTELPVALFVVDAEFTIIEFNPAAEEITGWKREEVLGRRCNAVFSSSLCAHHCPLEESRKTGEACQGREAFIGIRGGEELPIIFSSRIILDELGQMICGIEVFRDATDVVQLAAHRHNLISLFTHDLKAPVAISGGFVNRLLMGKAGELNEKQQQYLEIIAREIHRQEEYILAFLDIARIESGQIELQLEEVDLVPLLTEIAAGFEIQAAEKNIRLELELPPALQGKRIDHLQIGRVFSNLLDNAIKYSSREGVVRIVGQQKEDQLLIRIQDQGTGISIQDQAHVFDHFFRIDDQRRTTQGSGLGLAAVKAIVKAHNGRVWLRSEPENGSTFYISLPRQ